MSDKVQLIKEEIERRLKSLPKETEHNGLKAVYGGIAHELTELIQFIDSPSEEPASEDLEEEIKNYFSGWCMRGSRELECFFQTARHFAEWGRNHFEDKSEMVSKDLEEAATKWNETASFQPFYMQLDCNGNPCEVKQDIITHKESFKAGAEWQKQHMKEALQTEYEKGKFDMREEMMKNAVDAIFIQDYAYKTPILYGNLKYKMNIVSGQTIKFCKIKEE